MRSLSDAMGSTPRAPGGSGDAGGVTSAYRSLIDALPGRTREG
jgi:hypothetical protein